MVTPRSFLQQGPIFLNQLVCSDLDRNLLDCSRGSRIIGLTSCDHTQDVWVECEGELPLPDSECTACNTVIFVMCCCYFRYR